MSENEIADDALLEEMRRGNENALAALIDRYTAYVWAIVWNIVRNRLPAADGKDIVSEAFYSLWKSADRISPGRLKAYLSRIARSKAVDALRRRRDFEPLEEDTLRLTTEGPETEAMRREEYEALRRALAAMPEPDRTVFVRHYYLYQTTAEVAEATGVPVNTVKSKLRRGREKLRRELTEGGYFIG